MQDDLYLLGLPTEVHILGVNQTGFESANETISALGDVPWLQETAEVPVWAPWNVTYRDVIIVDEDNIVTGVFNLTANNLSDTDTYNELKAMFVSAAGG